MDAGAGNPPNGITEGNPGVKAKVKRRKVKVLFIFGNESGLPE